MPRNQCSVCGFISDQPGSPAVVPRQAPDLDTRPGEPLRSTLPAWLQHCPQCGYAAPDLAYAAEGVAAWVRSAEYQALDGPFERHSWLLEHLGHGVDAGWLALHAAWANDDAGAAEAARRNRRRAILLFQGAKAAGQDFLDTPAEELALAVDLLRRQGLFEAAAETVRVAQQDDELPEMIDQLLRFQMALIQKRDAARHSLDELPERPEGGTKVEIG